MTTGNPTTLNIGDTINLATGVKATLYTSVPVGATVVLPVVTQTATSTSVPIVAFAPFHIDVSLGGIQVHPGTFRRRREDDRRRDRRRAVLRHLRAAAARVLSLRAGAPQQHEEREQRHDRADLRPLQPRVQVFDGRQQPMSAIAVCSPRSQPSCQPIASRHAIAMPSQAARSATRTGSPRAWRRPAPPRASGRRVNASTRCTRRRSPAPRCTLARHTRRQAAGPRGGARRTAPATRARTRCLARGGACARAPCRRRTGVAIRRRRSGCSMR